MNRRSELNRTRVITRRPIHRSWEWAERWGHNFTDITNWTISRTDYGPITIRREAESILMSPEVAERVRDLLTAALTPQDETESEPTP